MRLRGAAVLFWLLPKEDGKRDLRALPLKNPFKGRARSAHSLPLKIPTFWVKPTASLYMPLPEREGMGEGTTRNRNLYRLKATANLI